MRCFALLALACAAVLDTSSSAAVEAGTKTKVKVWANAYDKRSSSCSPDGCKPSNVRDGSTDANSRWSCNYDLEGEDCQICFKFKDFQDIDYIGVAFHKGNKRKRSFYVNTYGKYDDDEYSFKSSGKTLDYEKFNIDSEDTKKMCITAKDLDEDDWFSITEVKIWV